MKKPTAVDELCIQVLVDNSTDFLSSTGPGVETELSGFWRRGPRFLAGQQLCCAAHGFSCAITVRSGDTSRTLLFDAGPDGEVLARNAERLGFDFGCVDGVVLSHGHWDHAGGLTRALSLTRHSGAAGSTPTFMHPGMYRSRSMRGPGGAMLPFADIPSRRDLESAGAQVIESTEPQTVLDDLFFISGEIPRLTGYEEGLPGQHALGKDGATWIPDPLVIDERFVAVRVKGRGAFVFTACSHAGVINVLTEAQRLLPDDQLFGVIGGFHLAGPNERAIPQTVNALKAFQLNQLHPAHCTGWRATAALHNAFGDAIVPSAVGMTIKVAAK